MAWRRDQSLQLVRRSTLKAKAAKPGIGLVPQLLRGEAPTKESDFLDCGFPGRKCFRTGTAG